MFDAGANILDVWIILKSMTMNLLRLFSFPTFSSPLSILRSHSVLYELAGCTILLPKGDVRVM